MRVTLLVKLKFDNEMKIFSKVTTSKKLNVLVGE